MRSWLNTSVSAGANWLGLIWTLDDNEAIIIMVDSSLQRRKILPSVKRGNNRGNPTGGAGAVRNRLPNL